MEIFNLQNLTFCFPEQTEPVLRDISFSVTPGEFVVLAGPSGCGKSTLLRQLKTVLAPHGELTGQLQFMGKPLAETDLAVQTARIGFVQQSPENQIVTDKVWHELAFGLESLGYDTPTIRSRVAEMARNIPWPLFFSCFPTCSGVPSPSRAPWSINRTRLHRGKTSSSRCSVMRTVVPNSRLIRPRVERKSVAAMGSSWLVGSSRTSTEGCIAMIAARFSNCFCPPDSSDTFL